MNWFDISILGVRLSARGYAGIVGAIIVTALVIGYAVGVAML